MEAYKSAPMLIIMVLSLFTLVGCGSSTSNGHANQTTQAQHHSVTKFSSGPTSKAWILGTITGSTPNVKEGTTLSITGQLARVQRNPVIHVTLYQSKEANYRENAVRLVEKDLPVTGSATFNGTITVPKFDKSNGSYFTVTFEYDGVSDIFSVAIQN